MNHDVSKEDLNAVWGGTENEVGVQEKDKVGENCGTSVGQEEGSVGPASSTNSLHLVKGGVRRRLSNSEDMGPPFKPILSHNNDSGGVGVLKGGVYSEGARDVYILLNSGPKANTTPKKQVGVTKNRNTCVLPSASLRKQQHMQRSLNARNSNSMATSSFSCSRQANLGAAVSKSGALPITSKGEVQTCSVSQAEVIPSSCSIKSSNIKNCNKLFWKKYEQEVASKVWDEALELGVELNEAEAVAEPEKL
jgi:hypothetical protein